MILASSCWCWCRRAQEELAKKIAAEEAAEAEAKAAREAKEAAEAAEKAEAEAAARALAEQAKEALPLPSPPSEPVASSGADAEEGSVHGSSVDVQVNNSHVHTFAVCVTQAIATMLHLDALTRNLPALLNTARCGWAADISILCVGRRIAAWRRMRSAMRRG